MQSFRAQIAIRIRILNYVERPMWPVHGVLPIVSGPVLMRKTCRGRDLENVARRPGPPTGEFLPPTGEPLLPSMGRRSERKEKTTKEHLISVSLEV